MNEFPVAALPAGLKIRMTQILLAALLVIFPVFAFADELDDSTKTSEY